MVYSYEVQHRKKSIELTGPGLRRIFWQGQFSGEIRRDIGARQVAFEIHALAMGGNWRARLFRDQTAFGLAGRAISDRIREIVETTPARK